jgi:hypothetical protein
VTEATSDVELRSTVSQGHTNGKDAKDGIENHIEPEPIRIDRPINRVVNVPSDGDMAVVNSADGHGQHDNACDKGKDPA